MDIFLICSLGCVFVGDGCILFCLNPPQGCLALSPEGPSQDDMGVCHVEWETHLRRVVFAALPLKLRFCRVGGHQEDVVGGFGRATRQNILTAVCVNFLDDLMLR